MTLRVLRGFEELGQEQSEYRGQQEMFILLEDLMPSRRCGLFGT